MCFKGPDRNVQAIGFATEINIEDNDWEEATSGSTDRR
jgi:hypothetical protein